MNSFTFSLFTLTFYLRTSFAGGDDGDSGSIHFVKTARVATQTLPVGSHPIIFPFVSYLSSGGDDGIRTHDPLLAGQVLSQLSYTPIKVVVSLLRCFTLLRSFSEE